MQTCMDRDSTGFSQTRPSRHAWWFIQTHSPLQCEACCGYARLCGSSWCMEVSLIQVFVNVSTGTAGAQRIPNLLAGFPFQASQWWDLVTLPWKPPGDGWVLMSEVQRSTLTSVSFISPYSSNWHSFLFVLVQTHFTISICITSLLRMNGSHTLEIDRVELLMSLGNASCHRFST